MLKEKVQVHMLPTDKYIRGYALGLNKIINELRTLVYPVPGLPESLWQQNYIYFTTDEEIKEGDWFIFDPNKSNIPIKAEIIGHGIGNWLIAGLGEAKKIVATTNPELWKTAVIMDGGTFSRLHYNRPINGKILVPKIGLDFVEAYVKAYNEGNPIKEVTLEIEFKNADSYIQQFKIRSNGTVIIFPVKERVYTYKEIYDMFAKLSYEMAQKIIGNRPEITSPIIPHEWFEQTYPNT